jgi:hypothetical protein
MSRDSSIGNLQSHGIGSWTTSNTIFCTLRLSDAVIAFSFLQLAALPAALVSRRLVDFDELIKWTFRAAERAPPRFDLVGIASPRHVNHRPLLKTLRLLKTCGKRIENYDSSD